MIALMFEQRFRDKAKEHLKKNWKMYGLGLGAVTGTLASEKILRDKVKNQVGEAADKSELSANNMRLARSLGMIGTGWKMKSMYNKNSKPS